MDAETNMVKHQCKQLDLQIAASLLQVRRLADDSFAVICKNPRPLVRLMPTTILHYELLADGLWH